MMNEKQIAQEVRCNESKIVLLELGSKKIIKIISLILRLKKIKTKVL